MANLQAGYNLDALIAERVFGWKRGFDTEIIEHDGDPEDEDYLEPFPGFDVYLQRPDGLKVYLYGCVDLESEPGAANDWYITDDKDSLPAYSTNDGAAMTVVDKLLSRDDVSVIAVYNLYFDEWACEIERIYVDDDEALRISRGETRPLAICRAALEVTE